MKIWTRRVAAAMLALAPLLTGCASVPMTSLEQDEKAKTFAVAPDKSAIYLYRHETLGLAVKMTVALDGKVAGQTGPQTYFLWEVAPGPHEVSSISENTSTVQVNTQPGKAYFIWQEMKIGWVSPRSELHVVEKETASPCITGCKRAQSNL